MKWYLFKRKSDGEIFKKWWGGFDLMDWDDFETQLLANYPNYEWVSLEESRIKNAVLERASVTIFRTELDGSDIFLKKDAEDGSKPWFYYGSEIDGFTSQVQGDEKISIECGFDMEATGFCDVLKELKNRNPNVHFYQKMMNRFIHENGKRYFDFCSQNYLNHSYVNNTDINYDWITHEIPEKNWLNFITQGKTDDAIPTDIYGSLLGDVAHDVYWKLDDPQLHKQLNASNTSPGATYNVCINDINIKWVPNFGDNVDDFKNIKSTDDLIAYLVANYPKYFNFITYNDFSNWRIANKYNYLLYDGDVLKWDKNTGNNPPNAESSCELLIPGDYENSAGVLPYQFTEAFDYDYFAIHSVNDVGIKFEVEPVTNELIEIRRTGQNDNTKNTVFVKFDDKTNNKNYFRSFLSYKFSESSQTSWTNPDGTTDTYAGIILHDTDAEDTQASPIFVGEVIIDQAMFFNKNNKTRNNIEVEVVNTCAGQTSTWSGQWFWNNKGENDFNLTAVDANLWTIAQNADGTWNITFKGTGDLPEGCLVYKVTFNSICIGYGVIVERTPESDAVTYDYIKIYDKVDVYSSISVSNDTNDGLIGVAQGYQMIYTEFNSQKGAGVGWFLQNAWILIPEYQSRLVEEEIEYDGKNYSATFFQQNFRECLQYNYLKTNPLTFCASRIHPWILSAARQRNLLDNEHSWSESHLITRRDESPSGQWNDCPPAFYNFQIINEPVGLWSHDKTASAVYMPGKQHEDKLIQTTFPFAEVPCMVLFEHPISILLGNTTHNFFEPINNINNFAKSWNADLTKIPDNTLENEPSLWNKTFYTFGIDMTKDGKCTLDTRMIDFSKLLMSEWVLNLNVSVGTGFCYQFDMRTIYNDKFSTTPVFSETLFMDNSALRYQVSQFNNWLADNQAQLAETKREIDSNHTLDRISEGISGALNILGGIISMGTGIASGGAAGVLGIMGLTKGITGTITGAMREQQQYENQKNRLDAQLSDRSNAQNIVHGLNYTTDNFSDYGDNWVYENKATLESQKLHWNLVKKTGYLVNSWFNFVEYDNRELFNFIKLDRDNDFTLLSNIILDALRPAKLNYSTKVLNHFITLFKTGVCLHKHDLEYSESNYAKNIEINP